jgi:orotidine-5'-phosphate decarboxylase
MLRHIIEATEGQVCAYKFNLAHFEALGWEGVELLYCVRKMLPDDVLIIADAKRGDIGSTARQYAEALYGKLNADSATVNPLMGRDSAEPFLAWTDRLTFFLVLTSNPGAGDFLLQDGLYERIAESVVRWNGSGNCGFVAGATRPEQLSGLRAGAPGVPFLVPGVGAQGGDLAASLQHGGGTKRDGSVILHVTRGILLGKQDEGDVRDIIRRKVEHWNQLVEEACR